MGLTRVLESLLFGVEALDAITFWAMGAPMPAVALLAQLRPCPGARPQWIRWTSRGACDPPDAVAQDE